MLLIKQEFLVFSLVFFFFPSTEKFSATTILESFDTYSLTSRSWSTSWGFVKSGSCASKWIIYGTTYSGNNDSNFSTVRNKKHTYTHASQDTLFQRITFSKKECKTYTCIIFAENFISNKSLKINKWVLLLQNYLPSLQEEVIKTSENFIFQVKQLP